MRFVPYDYHDKYGFKISDTITKRKKEKEKQNGYAIVARDSIDLLLDVKDRKIDQSIVFHRNIGWERRTFRT